MMGECGGFFFLISADLFFRFSLQFCGSHISSLKCLVFSSSSAISIYVYAGVCFSVDVSADAVGGWVVFVYSCVPFWYKIHVKNPEASKLPIFFSSDTNILWLFPLMPLQRRARVGIA
jgi:hypothetical protein